MFNCFHCQMKFSYQILLNNHVEMEHPNVQSQRLVHPPPGFTSPDESPETKKLKFGGERSEGHELFHCSHCRKTYRSLAALNQHMEYHKGEHPYACSYCAKSFKSAGNKKLHEVKLRRVFINLTLS